MIATRQDPVMEKKIKELGFENDFITVGDVHLQEILSSQAKVYILQNPNPILPKEKIQQLSSSKITLVLLGDGDYRMKPTISKFVKELRKSGKEIEALVIIELEISPKILQKLLKNMKDSLKALKISRVPLEDEHLKALNNLNLKLEYLSLSYVESDERDAFNNADDSKSKPENKPFDINLLQLDRLSHGLSILELKGVNLEEQTWRNIEKQFKNTLKCLVLEDISGKVKNKDNLMDLILSSVEFFENLKCLSLAQNQMDNVPFADPSKKFPKSLETLNFNYSSLSTQQVTELAKDLAESECELKALHLQGCYVYSRIHASIKKRMKADKNKLLIDMPIPALDPQNLKAIVEGSKSKSQELINKLLQVSDDFETIARNREPAAKWVEDLRMRGDFHQFLPFFMKLLREVKGFLSGYRNEKMDFFSEHNLIIPKHNFKKCYEQFSLDLNMTLTEGLSPIQEHQGHLVGRTHSKVVTDDGWAQNSMKEQRQKFSQLMEDLGYAHSVKITNDTITDEFVVLIKSLKQANWDYYLATFAVIWCPAFDLVTVKFKLSDDWFLGREERINQYALPNLDFFVAFCNEWNYHNPDFVFVIDVLKEGEAEISFKHAIMAKGDFNLAKALLTTIDMGFIILKTLHKRNLFENSDVNKAFSEAKLARKIIKEKLKKYKKSEGFINFLKGQTAMLGEDEDLKNI